MITCNLGGVSRELKFSAYTLMLAEDEVKTSFVLENPFKNITHKKLIVFMWASLLHQNKNLTIEQAAELMPKKEDDIFELTLRLIDAYNAYRGVLPEEDEKKTVIGDVNVKKNGKSSKASQ